jgi:hypothetical protein
MDGNRVNRDLAWLLVDVAFVYLAMLFSQESYAKPKQTKDVFPQLLRLVVMYSTSSLTGDGLHCAQIARLSS